MYTAAACRPITSGQRRGAHFAARQSLNKIAILRGSIFAHKIIIFCEFCLGAQFLRKFATLWSAVFCKVRKFCNLRDREDIYVFPLKIAFSVLGWHAINFCANWAPYSYQCKIHLTLNTTDSMCFMQLYKELGCITVTVLYFLHTRSPAIAEGPRDAGVPVEIW